MSLGAERPYLGCGARDLLLPPASATRIQRCGQVPPSGAGRTAGGRAVAGELGHPGTLSQVRLATFLSHVESVAAPLLATSGPLTVELTVGLGPDVPLCTPGRDLDNYLYPLAQRVGPRRLAAVFGRKVDGSSSLAIGLTEPEPPTAQLSFVTRLSGSCERPRWKETLRQRLRQADVSVAPPGPVTMDIAITYRLTLCTMPSSTLGGVLGSDGSR